VSAWEAIVVDGRERDLRVFIAGFAGDRGIDPGAVILGDDVGLEAGSVGEWLLELIGKGHHVVLAPAPLAEALAEAIRKSGDEIGLRIERRHPVAGVRFDVQVETFSREVASAVRAAIDAPPEGIRVESRQESEKSTGEAHGVALYAPVHDYTFTLTARVTGPVAGVLEVRRRLSEIEAATLGPLHVTEPAA
jgi:hypothetical protein